MTVFEKVVEYMQGRWFVRIIPDGRPDLFCVFLDDTTLYHGSELQLYTVRLHSQYIDEEDFEGIYSSYKISELINFMPLEDEKIIEKLNIPFAKRLLRSR